MERAPTSKPITRMQLVVATMAGLNLGHDAIAKELGITVRAVRWHLDEAAKRIPGDLPREQRVVAWVRGASVDVLEGRSLRFEVMRDGQAAIDEMTSLAV